MTHSILKQKIIALVAQIPSQQVMYFGQIAKLIGGNPRTVGWIMSGLSPEECTLIPWYRVVAKNGHISALKLGFKGQVQKDILIQQNYILNGDFVDMKKHTLTDLTILRLI